MIERQYAYAQMEVAYRLYIYPGYAHQGVVGELYAMLREAAK